MRTVRARSDGTYSRSASALYLVCLVYKVWYTSSSTQIYITSSFCYSTTGLDAFAQVHHSTELIAHKSHCPPFCSPFVKHRVKGASKKLCCLQNYVRFLFSWWCCLKPHGQYNCIEHIVCKGFKEFLTVLRGVAWSGCNCLSDQHGVQLRRPSITQLVKTLLPVSKHTMPLP